MNLHSISLSFADLAAELSAHPHRVNEKGYSGMTPLMFACWGSSVDKARYLIQNGAGVNIRNNAEATAFHYACRSGNIEMIELLISSGAEINVADRNGLSSLNEAIKRGKLEVAAFLMEMGAGQSLSNLLKSRGNKTVINNLFAKETDKQQFLQGEIADIGDVSEASFSRAQ